jgi:DNA-binding NarL/FixJ family response regulator
MSELARRCGATRLLTPADAHTVTVPVDLSSLTAREAEVATVAATGLRSREIADELGLSSRTVDLHLGRIYRKLGIASRTELVRLLLTRAAQLTR